MSQKTAAFVLSLNVKSKLMATQLPHGRLHRDRPFANKAPIRSNKTWTEERKKDRSENIKRFWEKKESKMVS